MTNLYKIAIQQDHTLEGEVFRVAAPDLESALALLRNHCADNHTYGYTVLTTELVGPVLISAE